MKLSRLLLLICLLLPLPLQAAAAPTFTSSTLDIKTKTGTLHFTVEEALSDEQHEYGLMFRKSLPKKHGMVFLFTPPKKVNFWMKDTLIPLDMLFVNASGTITQVTANAEPESKKLIPSGDEISLVIELTGGSAAHYHIASGDKVIYSRLP